MRAEEISEKLQREGLKPASLFKRAISMTIDDFLVSLIVIIAFYNQFSAAKTYEEVIILVDKLFLFIFAAYTLYHWLFIALYGKTIGKMIVKIRCVDIETLDNPPHIRALIRSIVRNFDEMFFYLGMLYAVVDPLNRAIHDIVGKCVVIEEKV
ncbi:RDD family protein [Caminibacter sp.]